MTQVFCGLPALPEITCIVKRNCLSTPLIEQILDKQSGTHTGHRRFGAVRSMRSSTAHLSQARCRPPSRAAAARRGRSASDGRLVPALSHAFAPRTLPRMCLANRLCRTTLSRRRAQVRWMGCSPSRSNVWSLLPQRLRVELSRRCLLAMPPSEMHLGHFA